MPEKKSQSPYIDYLESLNTDRGALAALRRGLGQPPGAAPEMFPYVVRWLPERCSERTEAAYYLIASLFAYHPESANSGNLGAHLRATIQREEDELAVERRFVALLNCHVDDLALHLRQAVSFLKSKEVPVHWQQLFDDLLHWDHPDHFIQKRWAGSFWGRNAANKVAVPEPNTDEN